MQVLVCLLLLSFTQYCSSEETLGRVVFANILYRQGVRTPLESYPNDPYKEESSWPVPFAHLTDLGKHQHSMLGRWLRDRYAHLLSPEYAEHDIYVSSIDASSTLASTEANLDGMCPSSDGFGIKKSVPIPVHPVAEEEDNVLAGKRFCERYSRELKRVLNSSEIQKIDERNSELYDYLSKKTGKKISSVEAVGLLYDTLFVEELYNKTLPPWTKSVYPKRLKPLAEKNFEIQAYNKLLQKLNAGPLLKEMILHMQLKSKDALMLNRKLWIYSAHDYSLANMLNTLGVFEPHCPPFAATLLIELRIKAQNDYLVTMFYKHSLKN